MRKVILTHECANVGVAVSFGGVQNVLVVLAEQPESGRLAIVSDTRQECTVEADEKTLSTRKHAFNVKIHLQKKATPGFQMQALHLSYPSLIHGARDVKTGKDDDALLTRQGCGITLCFTIQVLVDASR